MKKASGGMGPRVPRAPAAMASAIRAPAPRAARTRPSGLRRCDSMPTIGLPTISVNWRESRAGETPVYVCSGLNRTMTRQVPPPTASMSPMQ